MWGQGYLVIFAKDFYVGVCAAVVDKDQQPKWQESVAIPESLF